MEGDKDVYTAEEIQAEKDRIYAMASLNTRSSGKTSVEVSARKRLRLCHHCFFNKCVGYWVCTDNLHSPILYPRQQEPYFQM